MKKLALTAALVLGVAAADLALAQPYGPGYGPPDAARGYGPPGAGRASWDLSRRMSWLQQRIDRGIADGSLTRREGMRVQRELQRIRWEERRLRRMNGGRLMPDDRAALESRLDQLSDRIRWARHNDFARPW